MSALWIYDGKFSTAEIEAGVQAALASLAAAGYTVDEAYSASLAAAGDEAHDAKAAQAWEDADSAAILTAAAGWARLPEGAWLGLA